MKSGGSWWIGEAARAETEGEAEAKIGVSSSKRCVGIKETKLNDLEGIEKVVRGKVQEWHFRQGEKAIVTIQQTCGVLQIFQSSENIKRENHSESNTRMYKRRIAAGIGEGKLWDRS